MSTLRTVTITRNNERSISEILKEEDIYYLLSVRADKDTVYLRFSEESNYYLKRMVRQFSKEKYKSVEAVVINALEFAKNEVRGCFPRRPAWEMKQVVELPKAWIVFFEKIN